MKKRYLLPGQISTFVEPGYQPCTTGYSPAIKSDPDGTGGRSLAPWFVRVHLDRYVSAGSGHADHPQFHSSGRQDSDTSVAVDRLF
ncbi:MAG: hypothetical protein A07HR60_00600 [uncultured archaeon A07HR60]|nr:MAG: hypothetical protein J07HR59_01068 [Halorubrum sp. J07HR59]ESS12499.1 MAG: hypothetical protein A07HR60_00600 [uncultured archaeon A07HR60]